MQQDARDELKMISQARGASLSELPGYAYDSRGGRGITVYVIDSGINPNHEVRGTYYQESAIELTRFQEFRNMHGNIRWLYLPGQPHIEGDNKGHGTCVASKVASPTYGVAKSANIVVVRQDLLDGKVTPSSTIAAWGVVARDITLNGLQGKAVISVATSCEQSTS
jgi:cerevisin